MSKSEKRTRAARPMGPAQTTDGQSRPFKLQVRDLRVQYGGTVAVNDVSLAAESGRITGLIGPNGAGKTTVLNACSGFLAPSAGKIFINDADVTRVSPSRRARMGIGRSFQQIELCESLSVWDNVMLGREAAMAGASPMRQVFARRGDRRAIQGAASYAIARCGLGELGDKQVATLSGPERRFVEIARCIAGGYRLLLLDEPSSGLDATATERLGALLRTAVRGSDLGILIIEHDMSMVMSLCDEIYVMDAGAVLFYGTPSTVRASDTVKAAYLGTAYELDAGRGE